MTIRIMSLCLLLAATTALAAGVPAIAVTDPVRDLGSVRQGTTLELTFAVANHGDSPLEIDVRPTCGCTVADFDRVIAPRSSGRVEVRIDTTTFRGPITKAVLLLSNDPALPSQRLEVSADVHPVIDVLPRPLVRLEAQPGEAVSSSLMVVASDGEVSPFAITSVAVDSPWVSAEIEPVLAADRLAGHGASQYRLTVTLSDQAPPGLIQAPVTILTDSEEAGKVDVKVVGVVKAG